MKTLTKKQKEQLKKLDKTNVYGKCPVCNKGTYGGIFEKCCDNPKCQLYNSFNMSRCFICHAVRRDCCC